MEITVTIPDEVAAEARARGLTPESYVEGLIAEKHLSTSAESTTKQKLANLEKFFEAMAANSHKIPHLPDEALTRESFYQDRG
jgi:hypothetical protein